MQTIYSSPLFDKERRFDGSRFVKGALSISAPSCVNYIHEFVLQIAPLACSDETTVK